MESLINTTVILKALDTELKALLQADLDNFKAAERKQSQVKQAAWSAYIIILFYKKSSFAGLFFLNMRMM